MKILMLVPAFPYPPISGMRVRIYYLVKFLSLKNEISLLFLSNNETASNFSKASLSCFKDIFTITYQKDESKILEKDILTKISETFNPPVNLFSNFEKVEIIRTAIRNIWSENDYHVLYFSCLDMLPFVEPNLAKPFIFDVIDAASIRYFYEFKRTRRIKEKIRTYLNWLTVYNFEKKYLYFLPNILTIAAVDAAYLKKICPRSNIFVLNNGVDIDYFLPNDAKNKEPILMFSGNMDYEPNEKAAIYFIKEIYSVLKTNIPNVKFLIVGRNPTQKLIKISSEYDDIIITDYVEDLRPYFNQAMIYVSPLQSGAGIKNKILEAWSMAKPIVATPISVEGLKAKVNENVLLANKPIHFVSEIKKLIDNHNLRRKLGINGRLTVEQNYSWSQKADELDMFLRHIINQ